MNRWVGSPQRRKRLECEVAPGPLVPRHRQLQATMNLNKHDPQTEMGMDMTPMIDVVLLMVVLFMVTTAVTQQELDDPELVAEESREDRSDPKRVRPIVNFDFRGVGRLAASARGNDLFGYRGEFLGLVRTADSLATPVASRAGVDPGVVDLSRRN